MGVYPHAAKSGHAIDRGRGGRSESGGPPPPLTIMVTTWLALVTVLPLASFTVTTGCVVKAAPLAAPVALVVSTSFVAAEAAEGRLID